MRVLLIGINYAPEPSGIAPYTTGLAEHLVSVGHSVTVLTGMPHLPAWRVHDGYSRKLRVSEERNGVRVIRRAIYVRRDQSALKRAAYEASFLVSGLPLSGIDRPDAILGVIPSLSGGVLARLMSARFKVGYGLLFQDLMGPAATQSGISGGGQVARWASRAERWATDRARIVGAVSTAFFPYLQGLGIPEGRLTHIPNWSHVRRPDPWDRTSTRARMGWSDDDIVVLHAGNMGNKQHLEQVLVAAELAQNGAGSEASNVRFALMGDGNQRPYLEAEARSRTLKNVMFLPPEPETTYPDVLAAADVLLVSERASVTDMALPSKLTSYAAVGRPVIAAVNPNGATAREVERVGFGIVVAAEHPARLIQSINQLASDTEAVDRLGAAGRTFAASSLDAGAALRRAEAMVAAIAGDRASIRSHALGTAK